MKKIVFLFSLVVIIFTSCISMPDGGEAISSNSPYLIRTNDDFDGQTFISTKEMFDKATSLNLYISQNKNSKNLRAAFHYSGKSWIFFTEAIIKNSKNETVVFSFNYFDRKDRVGDGYVYESIDVALTEKQIMDLKTVLSGKNIQIRLSGDYYKVYDISDDYVAGLNQVVDLYLDEDVQKERLGTIKNKVTVYHPLFIANQEKDIDTVIQKTLAKAKGKYGENVELRNISLDSTWSPKSLFFYLDSFGYAESVSVEADVYEK